MTDVEELVDYGDEDEEETTQAVLGTAADHLPHSFYDKVSHIDANFHRANLYNYSMTCEEFDRHNVTIRMAIVNRLLSRFQEKHQLVCKVAQPVIDQFKKIDLFRNEIIERHFSDKSKDISNLELKPEHIECDPLAESVLAHSLNYYQRRSSR